MTKLRLNITMSLDGYVAGPNQSVAHPLGEGADNLHEWAFAVRTFRAMHGMEGGTTGPDDTIAAESLQNIGAEIMGRHKFGGGDGPWEDHPWNGWWGENPPFHMPVFVLTHHARSSARNAGRDHLPLRHRRDSLGVGAGEERCRGQRHRPGRRRQRCPAVPEGRPTRRDGSPRRSRALG